jgi:AraC-like DNA-binding protein
VDLLTPGLTDDLDTLLGQINVRSVVYCQSDLGAPWGLRVDGSPVAKFHLVLDGSAVLSVADPAAGSVSLSAGQLVLLPRGSAHVVGDLASSPARRLDRILADHPVGPDGGMTYGGPGPRTRLLCGGFTLEPGLGAHVLHTLPVLLVLDASGHGITRWLEPAFALLRDEAANPAPGAAAVLAKIADVFLTQAIRRYLAGFGAAIVPVSPAAAQDPVIGTALSLLRLHPDARWTVAGLASKSGLSRTAFAARFRDLVGEPPMTYLARLRLGHAAGYLATTDKTLPQIARLVGYHSESSFSQAFRRAFGRTPGEYRRAQLAAPAVLATPIAAGVPLELPEQQPAEGPPTSPRELEVHIHRRKTSWKAYPSPGDTE